MARRRAHAAARGASRRWSSARCSPRSGGWRLTSTRVAAALEEAQRRTAAVLRNVASGVVAVDADGRVSLANPRAEALLGDALVPGEHVRRRGAAEPSRARRRAFSRVDATTRRTSSWRSTRRSCAGARRASRAAVRVVTLDDVTELARAQRVLAWGEMARQVAHEIKNPLTPIRLGVQHLRRARADARVDFDRVLEHNVNQILTEIDRLDEIARAFSRYGAAPDERRTAAPIDVARGRARGGVARAHGRRTASIEWEEQGVDAPVMALRSNRRAQGSAAQRPRERAARRRARTVTVSRESSIGRDG